MTGKTSIEWTHMPGFEGDVWNPTTGCTRVSAGCDNCYAFTLHDKRFKANVDRARSHGFLGPWLIDDDGPITASSRERGDPMPWPKQYDLPFSRVQLLEDRLAAPLRKRKPTCYFVDSMADLWHADVTDQFLLAAWAVMEAAPQHRYLILTKRPERQREFLTRFAAVADEPKTEQPTYMRQPIPGAPGYYADTEGTIWSERRGAMRALAPNETSKWGHAHVVIHSGDGKPRQEKIARLVLRVFDGNPGHGEEARHLDGDPRNNRISNLSWGTRAENSADRTRHDHAVTRNVLTAPEVAAVRIAALAGEGHREIGSRFGISHTQVGRVASGESWAPRPREWIWLGTSVEDQRAADERIPHLLATPAAVRFLSCEPLLGPVDLVSMFDDGTALRALERGVAHYNVRLDWVIVGGESGPRARPMDLAWAGSLRDQCASAGVAFFVKQLGSKPMHEVQPWPGESKLTPWPTRESHGRNPDEWPEDLRVRTWPR